MSTKLDSFDQSKLDAFVQSKLDARNVLPSGTGRLFIRDGFSSQTSQLMRQVMWSGVRNRFEFVGQNIVGPVSINTTKDGISLYRGELLVSGNFQTPARYLARSIPEPVSWSTFLPAVDLPLDLIAASMGNLYVTRNANLPIITAIPDTLRIAFFNGTTWSACAQGLSGTIRALLGYGFGNMTVGGGFRILPDTVTVHNFANFNGVSFSARDVPTSGNVLSIGRFRGLGYAGCNAATGNNLFQDRGGWQQIIGTTGAINALHEDTVRNLLFVGGAFGIRSWDGAALVNIGGGVNGEVTAITGWQGNIVVSGRFTMAGGIRCDTPTTIYGNEPGLAGGYAVWNGSTWSALNTGSLSNNPRAALQMLEA